jgi:hypothetical protein
MNIYVGIDVGQKGGIFAFNDNDEVLCKEAIPQTKGTTDVDYHKMCAMLKHIRSKGGNGAKVITIIEDVHSLFGMSAKSNFSFGHIKGVKEGMLTALGMEYHLVQPKVWQKGVWISEDVVTVGDTKKKDTKATALNAASRIFPTVDFRKSSRAKIPHDGIVDAALMAEYARIVNN